MIAGSSREPSGCGNNEAKHFRTSFNRGTSYGAVPSANARHPDRVDGVLRKCNLELANGSEIGIPSYSVQRLGDIKEGAS